MTKKQIEAMATALAHVPTGLTEGNIFSIILNACWLERNGTDDHVARARKILREMALIALAQPRVPAPAVSGEGYE